MRRNGQAPREKPFVMSDLFKIPDTLRMKAVKKQHMIVINGFFRARNKDDPFLFRICPYIRIVINIIMTGEGEPIKTERSGDINHVLGR